MADSGSGREQVMFVPPLSSDIEACAIIVDLQFGERHTSEALNRKNAGIVRPGVFRGFECTPAGGLDLLVSSSSIAPKNGVTYVEYDNYSLTVFQQHDVTITLTEGEWYVVVEANYKWGVITKQVDTRSLVDAGSIKVIAPADKADNQTVLCKVTIPAGVTELTDEHIDFTDRPSGGHDLESHLNHPDPHPQYLLESELESVGSDIFERQDNAATDADIDAESVATKHVKLPQLWRALTNWLTSLKAEDDPFPQYLHNNEAATNAQAIEGTNAGVWMSALRSMEQLKSRISSSLSGTRTDYSASESALGQVNTKAENAQNTADNAVNLANAAQETADNATDLANAAQDALDAFKAEGNPFPQYLHNDEHATQAQAEEGTSAGVWMSPLRTAQHFLSKLSDKIDGTSHVLAASEYALGLVNKKAEDAYSESNPPPSSAALIVSIYESATEDFEEEIALSKPLSDFSAVIVTALIRSDTSAYTSSVTIPTDMWLVDIDNTLEPLKRWAIGDGNDKDRWVYINMWRHSDTQIHCSTSNDTLTGVRILAIHGM
ncbi:hypothetical protein I6Y99_004420 [Vibrio parahaemolyticus]|nr:hypothetical protein [Vibrio parahaemolyticus]